MVPFSTELGRERQATCVRVNRTTSNGLDADSVAVCHLLTAAPKKFALSAKPLGRIDDADLARIRYTVADLLGIDAETFLAGP